MRKTVVLLLAVAGLSGCSGKAVDRVKKVNQMRQIGLAFHAFCDDHDAQGPTKPDDLKPYLKDTDAGSLLTSGEVVFIWGVSAREASKLSPDGTRTILAYEKDAPTKGGVVLFGGGEAESI